MKTTLALLVCVHLCATVANSQQSKAIETQLTHVATALSSGSPEEAMIPFDKAYADRSRLLDYFSGLTNAYHLTNEMEITSEDIVNHEATFTVRWTLTMTDRKTDISESRVEDLTIKFSMKKYDWLIESLSPLEFFNPELRGKSK